MKIINTNLNHYKAFLEIYETKNYSVAAENLHFTQPTMSYNIRELEKQLKVRLFNTNSRGVEPTQHAIELYPSIRKAFIDLLKAEESIREFNEHSDGIIRLGVSLFYMPHIVSEIISKYNQKYPNVNFKITAATINTNLHALERHDKDIAIIATTEKNFKAPKDMTAIKIAEIENVFFAGIEYAKKHNLTPAVDVSKLHELEVISMPLTSPMGSFVAKSGIGAQIHESSSAQMIIELAKRNLGIFLGPTNVSKTEGLVEFKVNNFEVPNICIYMLYNNDVANKAAAALISQFTKQ
ncbi:MAG: LysR family transcriptional regulator [Firmicutes bacterium]|nr:LysR family transcriptional regulator [Bacillota bacterium]